MANLKIRELSDASYDSGSGTVSFLLTTSDGVRTPLSCSMVGVADLLAFFFKIAFDAGASGQMGVTYAYAPANGLGFAAGPTPDVTFLIVRLGAADLYFQIANSELSRLGTDLSQILQTINADPTKPQ